MEISLKRSYKSKNGNTVFVYAVKGTQSELEAFADAQGSNHRIDEETGEALWFTTRCVGKEGKLLITSNNKVVPDMSEFDQAASLAKQFGGNFGDQLARMAAEKLLGKSSVSTTAQTPRIQANNDLGSL